MHAAEHRDARLVGDSLRYIEPVQLGMREPAYGYITLKVIYSGLYRTAKPLYTVCRTVATGNRKEMTGRTDEISVVSGTQRVLDLIIIVIIIIIIIL